MAAHYEVTKLPKGSSKARLVNSREEVEKLAEKLTQGEKDITPSTYNGVLKELKDGTKIGIREGSTSRGGFIAWKVHYNH